MSLVFALESSHAVMLHALDHPVPESDVVDDGDLRIQRISYRRLQCRINRRNPPKFWFSFWFLHLGGYMDRCTLVMGVVFLQPCGKRSQTTSQFSSSTVSPPFKSTKHPDPSDNVKKVLLAAGASGMRSPFLPGRSSANTPSQTQHRPESVYAGAVGVGGTWQHPLWDDGRIFCVPQRYPLTLPRSLHQLRQKVLGRFPPKRPGGCFNVSSHHHRSTCARHPRVPQICQLAIDLLDTGTSLFGALCKQEQCAWTCSATPVWRGLVVPSCSGCEKIWYVLISVGWAVEEKACALMITLYSSAVWVSPTTTIAGRPCRFAKASGRSQVRIEDYRMDRSWIQEIYETALSRNHPNWELPHSVLATRCVCEMFPWTNRSSFYASISGYVRYTREIYKFANFDTTQFCSSILGSHEWTLWIDGFSCCLPISAQSTALPSLLVYAHALRDGQLE